ncbi:unnamed protein product [Pleuronectes platessa]|uniref:Uncharacterized protein n=1 Tax=Pleuronectes platessa TaxID=8262 RepID=A0A9N7Y827_PLEPL|nr:unnamed protein product [Pleuronectes platessa]
MDSDHELCQHAKRFHLTLEPSPDATAVARAYHRRGSAVAYEIKRPETVREEAKARVLLAGGDPDSWQLVLSENELQFGQYQGHDIQVAAQPRRGPRLWCIDVPPEREGSRGHLPVASRPQQRCPRLLRPTVPRSHPGDTVA